MPKPYPPTPAIDHLREVQPQTQTIGEFLEWCDEHGVRLVRWTDDRIPLIQQTDTVIAAWAEVDLKAVEAEKRAILEWVREADA
jgi:UV DNA damage repair endonuclease